MRAPVAPYKEVSVLGEVPDGVAVLATEVSFSAVAPVTFQRAVPGWKVMPVGITSVITTAVAALLPVFV